MSAREVAMRMLEELFDPPRPEAPGAGESVGGGDAGNLSLMDFQREGVERVRAVLRRRGGAVLADSVGLGKTYVALALVEEGLRSGGDAVLVVPASTRDLWRRPLRRLADSGEGWRLFSHTQLSRGLAFSPAPRGSRLLVVDEAHRFRNPRTLRYAALARLAAPGTRVLLVTATPINNRPADLLHLIRLFAEDAAFQDLGVPSLREAFGMPGVGSIQPAGAARPDDARVAAVVRSVVVRRTRAMIARRFESATRHHFPRREPPRVVRYNDPSLPKLVGGVGDLELPAHSLTYADPRPPPRAGSGTSAGALVRLGLLKRLDSSQAAFRWSLLRLLALTRTALDAARVGRILAPASGPAYGRGSDVDPLQLTMVELVARTAPPDADMPALVDALRRDVGKVEAMLRLRSASASRCSGPAGCGDGKLLALHELLDGLGGEKALVFTEFRDTAESLWTSLSGRFRVARVDGGGAWLGRRKAGRRVVVERFAPRSSGRPPPAARERVDVLITTDVLAEGVNLQDARHVVSYDLPWNPVRLLQRIGRVDRLGSPHQEIAIYLFAPDRGLESMLGLIRRLRVKLSDITSLVGAEQADELLERLAQPAKFANGVERAVERLAAESTDAAESLRSLWIHERKRRGREAPRKPAGARAPSAALAGPSAAIPVHPGHPAAAVEWVILLQGPVEPLLLEVDSDGAITQAGAAAVAAIRLALCTDQEAQLEPSAMPVAALQRHMAAARAAVRAPAPLSHHQAGARVARRIRAGLADSGATPDPRAIRRADALLAHLAAPLGPAREAEMLRILQNHDSAPLPLLIDVVEQALGDEPGPGRPAAPTAVPDTPAAVSTASSVGEESPNALSILAALHVRVERPSSTG